MKFQRLGLSSPPVAVPLNAVGCHGARTLTCQGQRDFNDLTATRAVDLIAFILPEGFTNLEKKSYNSIWPGCGTIVFVIIQKSLSSISLLKDTQALSFILHKL